jgi:hypothetical protein
MQKIIKLVTHNNSELVMPLNEINMNKICIYYTRKFSRDINYPVLSEINLTDIKKVLL